MLTIITTTLKTTMKIVIDEYSVWQTGGHKSPRRLTGKVWSFSLHWTVPMLPTVSSENRSDHSEEPSFSDIFYMYDK